MEQSTFKAIVMELIFNELSVYPLAEDPSLAEERFKVLLRTFSKLKTKHNFKHIRFPENYHNLNITTSTTFSAWLNSPEINRTIKNLILELFKRPFLEDDLEDNEMDTYLNNNFCLQDNNVPINLAPKGLPLAFIKSLPSISLNSHSYWQSDKITVTKLNIFGGQNSTFEVINLCNENDLLGNNFLEWELVVLSTETMSLEFLTKYLGFSRYKVLFNNSFLEELEDWKKSNPKVYHRLLTLMKDVEANPFSGGLGKTENLVHKEKEASKRITHSDRLSYTLEKDIVTFISCKGHYTFH